MSELIISTSGLVKEVNARIDEHVYTIRKLGAGDELDIQARAGKIAKIAKEASSLKGEYEALIKKGKTEDSPEVLALLDNLSEVMGRIEEARRAVEECYLRLFNDGTKDNKKSRELLERYGVEGLREINRRAFER